MNIPTSLTRWPALIGLAVLLVLAGGCSDRGKAKDEKARTEKRDIARVRALAEQLRRLDESLARLKQEADAQQSRINAVQADIAAARETLSELGLSYRPPAGDSAADVPPDARSADEQEAVRKRREKAENRTLDTLVILCFLAAVGAIGYSLWQRRPKDGGPEGGSAAAPAPVAPPPADPPADAPPAESPESAPYKEEPKGPPSAF